MTTLAKYIINIKYVPEIDSFWGVVKFPSEMHMKFDGKTYESAIERALYEVQKFTGDKYESKILINIFLNLQKTAYNILYAAYKYNAKHVPMLLMGLDKE